MKPIVSKSKTKPGIKISVVSRKNNCDLELVVPAQYCTSKHELVVKEYPEFKLEVKFSCKGGTYPKGLHLSFNGLEYPKDQNGDIRIEKGAAIKLTAYGKDYNGTLTVYRMAYMSSALLGKLRKKHKENKAFECVIHERHPQPSASKFTPYTVTNVKKPYSGGGF